MGSSGVAFSLISLTLSCISLLNSWKRREGKKGKKEEREEVLERKGRRREEGKEGGKEEGRRKGRERETRKKDQVKEFVHKTLQFTACSLRASPPPLSPPTISPPPLSHLRVPQQLVLRTDGYEADAIHRVWSGGEHPQRREVVGEGGREGGRVVVGGVSQRKVKVGPIRLANPV